MEKKIFNQNEIIKTHIKDFFKYIRMEGISYTELIDSREIIKNQFINENNRLTAKKINYGLQWILLNGKLQKILKKLIEFY